MPTPSTSPRSISISKRDADGPGAVPNHHHLHRPRSRFGYKNTGTDDNVTTATPRKNGAPLNLTMGWVGLLASVVFATAAIADGNALWPKFVAILVPISLISMFATRKSDEYTLSLWSTAANAAFAVTIAWLFLVPFLEGFYDGLSGSESGQNIPVDGAPYAALLVFYLTFNIKRLTGAF